MNDGFGLGLVLVLLLAGGRSLPVGVRDGGLCDGVPRGGEGYGCTW